MSDVLDRLRTSDPAADARGWSSSPTGESVRDRVVPVPRRRRSWVLAVAAAAVVLALAIGVAVVTTATDTSPAKPVSDIQRLVHGKWHRLPQSPISPVGRAQLFETSKGILLWAEYSDSGTPPGFHGALYNPVTKKWKKLAEPPVVLTQEGVWTGHLLVFPRAALAYDLLHDAWRAISAPEVRVDESTLLVWASPNVVAVNAACELCRVFLAEPPVASAAYDPVRNRWREIASPPEGASYSAIAWSGRVVAVWGTLPASQTMQALGRDGFWRPVDGSVQPVMHATAALVRSGASVLWVGWDSHVGEIHWQQTRGDRLDVPGQSLPHPSICAVEAFTGPERSALVWCAQGERLHLLDTAADRWFELPATQSSIHPAVLWSRGSLYALTTGGGLLVLR